MHKKLILTSVLALTIAGPAFAIYDNNGQGATWDETNGYMIPDYLYNNAATEAHTGVTSGSVTAEAYYTWNGYPFDPGTFWPMGSVHGEVPAADQSTYDGWSAYITCRAGSFCEGSWGNNWHYNSSADQGTTSCYTALGGSSSYTTDPGAATIADCYSTETNAQTGEVNGCRMPANAAADAVMTGRYYAAWGENTCDLSTENAVAQCADGYTYESGRYLSGALNGATGTYNSSIGAIEYQISDGNNGTLELGRLTVGSMCSTMSTNALTITDPSNPYATPVTKYASVTDDSQTTGAIYCYCQGQGFSEGTDLSAYMSSGVNSGSHRFDTFGAINPSPWRLLTSYTDTSDCNTNCAAACRSMFETNASSGNGLVANDLLSVMRGEPQCEPNAIQILWNGATADAIAYNDSEYTWYDDAVRTPYDNIEEYGKTFVGWRFIDSTTGLPIQGTVPADEMPSDERYQISGTGGIPSQNPQNP